MTKQNEIIFGIDLGTTYSCIAYVDEFARPIVVLNSEGDHTTPSVVQFEGSNRVVGKEAKNSAVLNPHQVIEMVKRHMGEVNWRFECDEIEYTAEETSSYILRRLAHDTQEVLGYPVEDVVITCPAYFGIAQREATAQAGRIAGLNVREVINEPTAAAIIYGLHNEQDQVVLVYDLGGGTFDITVIEIKNGAITVVVTGGNNNLGGRDWDERIVNYLAEQWKTEADSSDDPQDSAETLQELWRKAEEAKYALTARTSTQVVVSHANKRVGVKLTRDKFNELTADLLERTIAYTVSTINEAKACGYSHFDQILLVGGSTKMPQVAERLKKEFNISLKIFEPDEAVAKGAAIYGYKLFIDEKIRIEIATMTGTSPDKVNISNVPSEYIEQAQQTIAYRDGLQLPTVERMAGLSITNVASHSFGIIALDENDHTKERKEIISNLVLVNTPLPITMTRQFGTSQFDQQTVLLTVMENDLPSWDIDDTNVGEEIAYVTLPLPPGLPENAPIQVTFELNKQGRLHIVGREPSSNSSIEAIIQTEHGISEEDLSIAQERASQLTIV